MVCAISHDISVWGGILDAGQNVAEHGWVDSIFHQGDVVATGYHRAVERPYPGDRSTCFDCVIFPLG